MLVPCPPSPPSTNHAPPCTLASDSPAADQPHQEQHDRNDQQDVDEVSERVPADHPEQPQHNEDDRNRFEHVHSPCRSCSRGWFDSTPSFHQQRLCRYAWRSAKTFIERRRTPVFSVDWLCFDHGI